MASELILTVLINSRHKGTAKVVLKYVPCINYKSYIVKIDITDEYII